MKKLLFIMTLIVGVTMTGCQKSDYKAKGEQMARQLDELCQKNDTAAVLALIDSIDVVEAEINAKNDTAGFRAFHSAVLAARERCMPFITVAKIENGQDKEEVLQALIDEALNSGLDMTAITSSINASLENEKAKSKK